MKMVVSCTHDNNKFNETQSFQSFMERIYEIAGFSAHHQNCVALFLVNFMGWNCEVNIKALI